MAYSNVGIANMALQRIGAKTSITSLTDGSPNAVKANTVWEYIRDEVLEAVKPKFATLRVSLAQSATAPVNDNLYLYAYPLPTDYLCLADDSKDDLAVYPIPGVAPYVIESLSTGVRCLMTNYDSTVTSADAIYMTYIQRAADPSIYSPSFINCFCYRLAAELCLSVAESGSKFDAMMKLYFDAKKKAKGASRAQDYLADEKGNTAYEYAGR